MRAADRAPAPTADGLPALTVDGLAFRDLDHDGVLAPYEDWRLPAEVRARDLLSRMTLVEKAGCMVHGTAPATGPLGMIGVGPGYDLDALGRLVRGRAVNAMITRLTLPPRELAEQNNAVQREAARARLGIPVTMSSDPRHHFASVIGASSRATGFSQWPEALGLAATGDADLVREFGAVVRHEYRAVGLHMLLGPQADLATSPRWPRAEGTFGEDPHLARRLVGAFVEGLQGGRDGLHATSVAAVVKHWVGYGAARDGYDGHNWYGRFSAFPSDALDDHVEAFLDALDAKVAGVMPTYNVLQDVLLDGRGLPQVGAGFNGPLVNGLLRGHHGFDGVVLSDWAITRDLTEAARTGTPPQTPDLIAMPWGVEDLTRTERFALCVNAGVDQIGGENDPTPLLDAVGAGLLDTERIDEAVLRILTDKFRLGLFENPLVDPDTAEQAVGEPRSHALALAAQHRSLTWITAPDGTRAFPLRRGTRVHLAGTSDLPPLDRTRAADRGLEITDDPRESDVAILRVTAPFQRLHPGHFFGRIQHEGNLDFAPDDPATGRIVDLCRTVPTLVVLHLDRPAVLTGVVEEAAAVLAEYGAGDEAILDVLTGRAEGTGRLPFRLHGSMTDVLAQPCDKPAADLPGRFPVGHRAAPATSKQPN